MSVYGLVRVSTQSQHDNTSLKLQATKIKDYCKVYDLELTDIIEETGSGGLEVDERKGLTELKKLIDDGDCKTMGGGEFTSDRMNEIVGRNYGDMMNQQPQAVPSSDPMSQFLNKDYREVLDKAEQKQKQKYGK